MDFFAHQEAARRGTTRLVVLFGLAVLAIMIAIELLLAVTMGYLGRDPRTGAPDWAGATDPALMIVAAIGTLIVVGGGSLFKIAQLRGGGGRTVAEQLGGRLVHPDSTEPVERRLLNVVEEMAIASGTPVPPVYLMDREDGINAFAAGFSPDDAVVGMTRGTATRLDRDELQGVIAHEFSHILNGDMRLNIRLMGLLHGILLIGMLGYFMLRMSFYARAGRSRDRNATGAILALGAGLAAIGFAGTFFGNLIKAGVSRQREFLADASAVQFTRQPGGLAGALRKIGGFISGSAIEHPKAPEASHMFFGRATSGLSGLFSTHPPLEERIRRIDPSWSGEFEASTPAAPAPEASAARAAAAGLAGAAPAGATGLAGAVAHVGQPTPAHVEHARQLVAALPASLRNAAHESYGSRAVIYALLLDERSDVRTRQLRHLQASADPAVLHETMRLAPEADDLDARLRLPLVEIALSALRSLTDDQYQRFHRNVEALVAADEAMDVFEWALSRLLLHGLEADRGDERSDRVRFRTIADVRSPVEVLLSVLARAGHDDERAAASAVAHGARKLGTPDVSLLPPERCSFDALDEALESLNGTTPALKRRILEAAAACIAADRQVLLSEVELLRAVSASIGCPMPPVI